MNTATDDAPVVNKEIWRAWVQKGELREKATARKLPESFLAYTRLEAHSIFLR